MAKGVLGRRVVLAAVSAIVAAPYISARAQGLPGAGRTVKPGRASWDTFWFGGLILSAGLEKLGYQVAAPKALQGAALYQGLAQGDIDFTPDIVMPNASASLERVKDQVVLAGPIIQPGSVAGLLIDKKTADQHKIAYVEDFLDPKIAALFSDGDGRARMIGPSAGWNDEKYAREFFKRLGLEKSINMVQGEYNILVADTISRYRAGKPVMLYAWYPNTATVQLRPGTDLTWLQVKPEHARADQAVADMAGCSLNSNPCNTGWDATTYMIAVNAKFAAANPAAMKFFNSIRMKLSDRADQNTKMMVGGEKSEADLKRHAGEWIKRNQKEFDAWIAAASAA